MSVTILNPVVGTWRRSFAWFPVRVKMQMQPAAGGAAAINEAYCGRADLPTLNIWLEYYEWRYTGRATSMHNEVEYKVGGQTYFQWDRNGYDC